MPKGCSRKEGPSGPSSDQPGDGHETHHFQHHALMTKGLDAARESKSAGHVASGERELGSSRQYFSQECFCGLMISCPMGQDSLDVLPTIWFDRARKGLRERYPSPRCVNLSTSLLVRSAWRRSQMLLSMKRRRKSLNTSPRHWCAYLDGDQ